MTTPDKCPKCGSDTARTTQFGRVFTCQADVILSIYHASPLCEMTQRAQRENKRGDEWKECAQGLHDSLCGRDCESRDNALEAFDALMKEEQ